MHPDIEGRDAYGLFADMALSLHRGVRREMGRGRSAN
jgi:hypothetical protein